MGRKNLVVRNSVNLETQSEEKLNPVVFWLLLCRKLQHLFAKLKSLEMYSCCYGIK